MLFSVLDKKYKCSDRAEEHLSYLYMYPVMAPRCTNDVMRALTEVGKTEHLVRGRCEAPRMLRAWVLVSGSCERDLQLYTVRSR